ncbi:MAG: zf-HC2 domain-containing protein [Planctomycetota bacterium]|nr:MAG: zf-HC2 domain-containing protein [Planctomycetota bacterium]
MNPRILTRCRESYRVLSDWLDGRLGRADRLWLRGHLLMCQKCRHYAAQFRKVHELTTGMEVAETPADFERVVAAVLDAWRRSQRPAS